MESACPNNPAQTIDRCYLEITNVCNLSCVFCPKTGRKQQVMSRDDFDRLTDRLRGHIKFLYLHLMGEPMLHPLLSEYIGMARSKGFIPVLTTNGTLLDRGLPTLPHKVQISLHSLEGQPGVADAGRAAVCDADYVDKVMRFGLDAAARGCIVVLRLWNQGGHDTLNDQLLRQVERHVPRPWTQRYDGWKLGERLYVEYDHLFEWPDEDRGPCADDEVFCYALRNQIGVLVDGTVVPCCLDHDGHIALGNLFEQPLDEILSSPRARAMYEGFSRHRAVEALCQSCGYAGVTKRFRKS